jgi:hypothetical protein
MDNSETYNGFNHINEVMRNPYYLLIITIFSFFLSSCTSQKKNGHETSDINDHDSISTDSVLTKVSGNCAIGPFHWNITSDAYSSITDHWIQQLSGKDNIPMFCGLRLRNDDAIRPAFDGDNHLIGLEIHFMKFSVTPEKDYTPEEKDEINKMYLDHNKKISHLIDELNFAYGDASTIHFEEDDTNLYSSNEEQCLAEWNTGATHASLKIKNENNDMTGCNLEMWLEINENKNNTLLH